MIVQKIKAADKNKDGKISKDEAPEKMKEHFDKIDKNSDGVADREEIGQMIRHIAMKAHRGHGGPGRGPAAKRGPGGPQRGPSARGGRPGGSPADRFKAADKNGDGKLSKEEAPERLKEHFDKIDTNADYQLEPSELREAFKKMMGKRRKAKD